MNPKKNKQKATPRHIIAKKQREKLESSKKAKRHYIQYKQYIINKTLYTTNVTGWLPWKKRL